MAERSGKSRASAHALSKLEALILQKVLNVHRSGNHELGTLSPRKGVAHFSCFLEIDHSLFEWTVNLMYTTLKMHYIFPKYQNVVSISTDTSPPVRLRTSRNTQCNQHALKKKSNPQDVSLLILLNLIYGKACISFSIQLSIQIIGFLLTSSQLISIIPKSTALSQSG